MSETERKGLDRRDLDHLLEVQLGVASRRQLVQLGAVDHEVARMLRRRELVPVHRGVFVNHTGPLSWEQRAYAAVLVHWPAALTGNSALPDPVRKGPIHVAIDLRRTVTPVDGVQARRTVDFEQRVDWIKCPPRVRYEHSVIDVAASEHPDTLAMYRVLADACQTRKTRPRAIRAALESRRRVTGKALMLDMLDDLATGACSVLERGYLLRQVMTFVHGLDESCDPGFARCQPTLGMTSAATSRRWSRSVRSSVCR